MIPWRGTPKGQWMRDAVSFREWRVNRSLYITAAAVMLFPWILILSTSIGGPGGELLELRAIVGDNAGLGPMNGWITALAGLLAVGVFWNDRSRGGLDTSMEGPVSRRALLMAKIRLGIFTITGVWVLLFVTLAFIALAIGQAGLIGPLVVAALWSLCSAVALYMVTVSFGAAMGSVFFTVLASLLWVLLPRIADSVVFQLTLGFGQRLSLATATGWETTLIDIRWFSVLTDGRPTGWVAVLYAGYFAAWALFVGWRALAWWERTPMERFHDPFYYPQLWNFWYAFLAILSGMFVAALTIPNAGSQARLYVGALVFGVPLWFLWRWIWRLLSRNALSWGPQS